MRFLATSPGRLRSGRGQGMVEFAFAFPILLIMLFATMEFGWLLFANHQVTNAAREGARYASVHGTKSQRLSEPAEINAYTINTAEVKAVIVDRVSLANADGMTVTVERPDGTLIPGNLVTVDVEYQFQPLIGIVISSPSITLSASSTMRVHY